MNSERYIRETLHSLIAQDYKRFELIVVDGGSSDDTLNILDRYSEGDIRVIELAPGLGIAKALNVGIEAAEGEFIARMDADDVAYFDRLTEQVNFLAAEPDVDLIGAGVDAFGDHVGAFRSPPNHEDILDEFLVNNPFFHPTIMFRRKLADQGLFRYDETHSFEEDYELWGRLIPRVRCANVPKSVIRYRIRANSTQWDPRKYRYKHRAIEAFCGSIGLNDDVLIDALAEFQCGSYIRHHHYLAMRNYALSAKDRQLPRLGWLHDALVSESSYAAFTHWFRMIKGWAV
jgi:glycosyltransferase involved in cell wall biosynthesis